MKRWWRSIRGRVLPPLVYIVARLIGATLRIRAVGYEAYEQMEGGKVFLGWHGRTFLAALFFRNKGLWTIISRSRDGEMQNRIFTMFGFNTIRGSTGRGGAKAAAESIRVLKKGETMAFTPDGPRGPSGVVQSGVMLMAKKSGAALVPVGVAASRKWHAPTWDRYMVPLPFARCLMVFGDPIFISRDASDEEVEFARQRLEKDIKIAQERADQGVMR
ncbi:MAG TPA: lysophospholipid acyltransferase family protein [Fimbriimonadaceae bacterium]|nr:lysophospholipid acyltransferase family protein [Fimbriimonadaceae bacterium]